MTGGATEPWTQVASSAHQHYCRTTALSLRTEPPGPTGLELGNGVSCGIHLIQPGAAAPQCWPCSVLLWAVHLTADAARLPPLPELLNFSINKQQLHPTLMCVAHKSFC